SWSMTLVGGADTASADPERILAGAAGNVIVEGSKPYTYVAPVKGTSTFNDDLLMSVGSAYVDPDAWFAAFSAANAMDPNATTFINFGAAPTNVRAFLLAQANAFFAPGEFEIIGPVSKPTGISTRLSRAAEFMAQVFAPNFATLKSEYKAPQITNV